MLQAWTDNTLPWCPTQTLKSAFFPPFLADNLHCPAVAFHDIVATDDRVFDLVEQERPR